jgi:hypothetical protein
MRAMVRAVRPPSDQPAAQLRQLQRLLALTGLLLTSENDLAANARVLDQCDVVARHLVHAALPLGRVPVVRVMDRPNVAAEVVEEEVAKRGAAAIVEEHQRQLGASLGRLDRRRVWASGKHDGQR